MTELEAVISASTPDELERAAVLLHLSGTAQRRLLGARGVSDRLLEPPFPWIFAACCVQLHLELVRRGLRKDPCPVCNGLIRGLGSRPLADALWASPALASGVPERAPTEALP